MKTPGQVSSNISSLTLDEDLSQDLWVHYLSGNSEDTFSARVDELTRDVILHQQLKNAIQELMSDPPSEALTQILDDFSEFERSIMCLLMLGLTPEGISGYKGISEVRIKQAIATIKVHASWTKFYGIKEELNRRREVRSKRGRDKARDQVPKKT